MTTLLDGVWSLLVELDFSSIRLFFAFIRPSEGLMAPGVRHVGRTRDLMMHWRQHYPIYGIVGTVSFIRFQKSVSQPIYETKDMVLPKNAIDNMRHVF